MDEESDRYSLDHVAPDGEASGACVGTVDLPALRLAGQGGERRSLMQDEPRQRIVADVGAPIGGTDGPGVGERDQPLHLLLGSRGAHSTLETGAVEHAGPVVPEPR